MSKPENKKITPLKGALVLCGLISLLVFFIDLSLPLGVAAGVPYTAVVAMAAWVGGKRHVVLTTGLSVFFIALGYILSPPGGEFTQVVANRFLSIFCVAVVASLALRLKWLESCGGETRDSRSKIVLS